MVDRTSAGLLSMGLTPFGRDPTLSATTGNRQARAVARYALLI